MMASINCLLLLSLTFRVTFSYTPCPIAGPAFLKPTNLTHDSTVQAAFKKLQSTLSAAGTSGKTPYGTVASNSTSFSLGLFDATEPNALLTFFHSAQALQQESEGTKKVNGDTIYRIGSVSKLITAYQFLIEAGPEYWSHSVTEYIPELLQAMNNCNSSGDAVDCIDWSAVTLGALGDHLANIPRDYSGPGELLSKPLPFTQYGFPPLSNSSVPTCNLGLTDPCPTDVYLEHLAANAPANAPFSTPLYSDAGYALLGLALERITGKTISSTIASDLFARLSMTSSSYTAPSDLSKAVLPRGPLKSGFLANLSTEVPTGGYYSSQNDLIRLGKSILSSSLLPPAITREWMKPNTFVSALNQGVGKPWEIWRDAKLTGRVVDLYTKSGDVFSYASYLVLIPDYDFGFVAMAAGDDATNAVQQLIDMAAGSILPALENSARAQSQAKLAGNYVSSSKHLNSSMALSTKQGQPGLVVQSWISNGTNFLDVLSSFEGGAVDVRLYPTNLMQQNSTSSQNVQYRAVVERLSTKSNGGVFSGQCTSWNLVDAITYGGIGLDEFVFVLNNGKATSLEPRALRTTLAHNS